MALALLVVLIIGSLNIFESVYFMVNGETKFGNPLWVIWVLWGVYFIALVFFFFARRYLQNKYVTKKNQATEMTELKPTDADYYYQLPIIKLFDRMPITINGLQQMTFELFFNNRWQKFLALFDFLNLAGLTLTSKQNKVIIQPIHLFKPRYLYHVYFNSEHYGSLAAEKFFKERGGTKYLSFTFKTEQEEFTVENNYLSLQVDMTHPSGKTIFHAERDFFSLEKDKAMGRRGEMHKIKLPPSKIPAEVLIAIYVQLMNIKNY